MPDRTVHRRLLIAAAVAVFLGACASGGYEPGRPVDSPRPPVRRPSQPEQPSSVRLLDEADRAYAAGDLQAAADRYEVVIAAADAVGLERALFRLAMIHYETSGPLPDPQRGKALLERLISTYPESLHAVPARHIVDAMKRVTEAQSRVRASESAATALRAEVRRLESQLEALKRIDLGDSRPAPRP